MKIEQQKLQIKHVDLGPLSELQNLYYSFLRSGLTIEGLADHYLKLGWLLSFTDLYDLLKKLHAKQALLNPEFAEIFDEKPTESLLSQWKEWIAPTALTTPDLSDLPFFRTLEPELLKTFQQKAQVFKLAPRTRLCRIGEVKRDLFVSLDGAIDVYKESSDAKLKWVTSIAPKSLFGEVSFFLGQPRTAEVVTRTETTIVRIRFDETFQQLIDAQGAESVMRRFWLIHALNASSLFSNLPESSFDQILNVGVMRNLPANQTIFNQGDKGNLCWVIIQGQVEISQDGKAIAQTKKGDLLGEVALMLSQGTRTATARTLTPVMALEIDQTLFYRLLSLNFVMGYQIEHLARLRIHKDHERGQTKVSQK